MRWKYFIPHLWDKPKTIWEDIYLLPDDPAWTDPLIWLTIDAVGPRSYPAHGLSAREYRKLVRDKFSCQKYTIDRNYMIVHANDFTHAEFLEWTRFWLATQGYEVSDLVAVPLEELEPSGDHGLLRDRMRGSGTEQDDPATSSA